MGERGPGPHTSIDMLGWERRMDDIGTRERQGES
jgi:hypothetical protein